MRNRKNLPVAALRAFEAAARHGRLTAAADELGVTHGAISRHVSHLEAIIGEPLFEGARNRPRLTPEGRLFGVALTAAFDQMEDALRLFAKGDENILDVACLSTFAMRWLIPRLHDFTEKYPGYSVRLATDDRPSRSQVDVQILAIPSSSALPDGHSILFDEQLGLVAAPSVVNALSDLQGDAPGIYRLETRTRPNVWSEWSRLARQEERFALASTRVFDHYHLTIEAALNGLGVAIAPWHLVAGDIESGRLIAPYGFLPSEYRYAVNVDRPGRRKAEHFVGWLVDVIAVFPAPPN